MPRLKSLFTKAHNAYHTFNLGINSPGVSEAEKSMAPAFAAAATIGLATANPGLIALGVTGLGLTGRHILTEGRAARKNFDL